MTARKYANHDGTLPPYNKNNLGDMIVGIKAALITGYQDTPSVDWEMLYESISNPSDTSKRIVVRSKAVDSERKVFEITDISDEEGSIKCWDNWLDGAGVGLLMQAKINKFTTWGQNLEIVADEKFVHIVVNAVHNCFGDIDVFDTSQPKTLLLDRNVISDVEPQIAIASTVNTSRVQFRDVANNRFILRSFCADYLGFGAKIASANAPVYDIYNGGDRGDYISNINTPLRRVEILKIIGGYYQCYGYLPMLLYTDNPRTMTNKKSVIDGKEKILRDTLSAVSAVQVFAVDV